jgi:hypothetical protein
MPPACPRFEAEFISIFCPTHIHLSFRKASAFLPFSCCPLASHHPPLTSPLKQRFVCSAEAGVTATGIGFWKCSFGGLKGVCGDESWEQPPWRCCERSAALEDGGCTKRGTKAVQKRFKNGAVQEQNTRRRHALSLLLHCEFVLLQEKLASSRMIQQANNCDNYEHLAASSCGRVGLHHMPHGKAAAPPSTLSLPSVVNLPADACHYRANTAIRNRFSAPTRHTHRFWGQPGQEWGCPRR